MLRRIFTLLIAISLLLVCGCVNLGQAKKYQVTYWTLFDTVTTVTGYASSQAEFDKMALSVHDCLLEYHRLFDIYNDYDGIANIKTINDNAGIAPVQVDQRIVALLLDCRAYCEATDGLVNVAMGSVLRLWHEARTAGLADPQNAALPDGAALQEAKKHTSWEHVVIDAEKSTVYLSDPEMSLDVGAIAKGWATQRAAESAPKGLLLSVGGNICATGPKPDKGTWLVGVQDPDDASAYLCTVDLAAGSVVTSGDYQRCYSVDGVSYHHIIHPDTLYPAEYWRSVTILCADSGMADMLSTALFLLPLAEGKALLAQYAAEAMWVAADGSVHYSDGFDGYLRN